MFAATRCLCQGNEISKSQKVKSPSGTITDAMPAGIAVENYVQWTLEAVTPVSRLSNMLNKCLNKFICMLG